MRCPRGVGEDAWHGFQKYAHHKVHHVDGVKANESVRKFRTVHSKKHLIAIGVAPTLSPEASSHT